MAPRSTPPQFEDEERAFDFEKRKEIASDVGKIERAFLRGDTKRALSHLLAAQKKYDWFLERPTLKRPAAAQKLAGLIDQHQDEINKLLPMSGAQPRLSEEHILNGLRDVDEG